MDEVGLCPTSSCLDLRPELHTTVTGSNKELAFAVLWFEAAHARPKPAWKTVGVPEGRAGADSKR